MDLVGDGGDQAAQEVARRAARHLLMQFDEGELRRSIDCDDEVEFALRGSDFSDVDMKIADRVSLEFPLGGGFAFDLGQARNPVPLQAAMKRRARQMRDGRLQGVEAVVERQQGVPSERHDHGFFLNRQDRRPRRPRPRWQIGNGGSRPPLCDGLRVDAVALRQRPQALLMVWTALAPILPR